jgi:hypothetical protein
MTAETDSSNLPQEITVADVDQDDDTGDDEERKEPRMSCCYGIMVFSGLAISLLALTLLVTYAGFWSNYAMQGKSNGRPVKLPKTYSRNNNKNIIINNKNK